MFHFSVTSSGVQVIIIAVLVFLLIAVHHGAQLFFGFRSQKRLKNR